MLKFSNKIPGEKREHNDLLAMVVTCIYTDIYLLLAMVLGGWGLFVWVMGQGQPLWIFIEEMLTRACTGCSFLDDH